MATALATVAPGLWSIACFPTWFSLEKPAPIGNYRRHANAGRPKTEALLHG